METLTRREQFAARVGPHLQVSDVRTVDVPAEPGVGAHRDFLVKTACGREVQTTLATRRAEAVRCPLCGGTATGTGLAER